MKKILLLISFAGIAFSCSSDITDMNTDPKRPTITKPEYLFTNAEKKVVDQIVSTSVNNNVFRLLSQQWAETTYPDESQYNLSNRKIPDNHFLVLYRDVLADLHDSKVMIQNQTTATPAEAAVKQNKIALIDILECYAYSILVDTFGNVPYSQAIDIEKYPLPAYDDAKTIYKDLIARLAADAVILKTNTANANFGIADIIYGGTAASNAKWVKFTNSLIVRLAVNISDVEPAYAATEIQAALASGVLASNADNTKLVYATTSGNQNPLYADLVTSNRNDFIPAEPFVAAMEFVVPGGDPRMAKYFVNAPAPAAPVIPAGRTFVGGTYGEANVFATYSHITATLNNPAVPGVIFDYAELQFLLAEAAEKNLIPGGSAQAKVYYDAGITASFLDWGLTAANATTYLASPKVDYTNVLSGATWKEKIGMQAWFALYNRGYEAYNSYRRLDFPVLASPTSAKNKGILTVPVRYTYPGVEALINGANYKKAASDIGGDLLETKIFWDKF
ncbi:SusD-like starch-binding protein associating with outer membrane [Flavobacterium chryseum]|uniref:SusD/RagB family nutrient-binding outer membrane lipoprotein n=1 Tax=Flavobacterium sp. P3160 TaxID=2512113 RepID=UPI0010DC324B|nr:SusD/RagB family nutrient-binding outer membrane lipoprotein [Flavobacterium sp. P3160]TDO69987.1 SusD-like starch-binding protein associating with outer membrane [Flavobacterium sp. P3160]